MGVLPLYPMSMVSIHRPIYVLCILTIHIPVSGADGKYQVYYRFYHRSRFYPITRDRNVTGPPIERAFVVHITTYPTLHLVCTLSDGADFPPYTMSSIRLASRYFPLTRVSTLRTLHSTPLRPASTASSPSKPEMTQGHGLRKKSDPLHGDADVQSAARSGAFNTQAHAQSKDSETSGDSEPLDAARQGSDGGEVKKTQAQKDDRGPDRMSGSFKDQVGGQDERDKGPGVEAGGNESAAGKGLGETIKSALGGSSKTTVGRSTNSDYGEKSSRWLVLIALSRERKTFQPPHET